MKSRLIFLLLAISSFTYGQGNYEIQVYGAETVAPGATMVELHTNFTVSGTKGVVDGVRPTNHQLHETLEITHGFNKWFETGFYIFTSLQDQYGWSFVGTHIRPRVRAPESWHLPVGLSLSQEIGYQRAVYSGDTWTWEIRPIVDKQMGKLYLSFNPVFGRTLHGPSVNRGVEFGPNVKAAYDVTKKVTFGVEYYGAFGPLRGFDPFREEQHQIVPVIDLNLGPNWEFNFGVGVGITGATDHLLIKAILGRRFNFKKEGTARMMQPLRRMAAVLRPQ